MKTWKVVAISMARTGMATFWQWLAFHEGLLSPLLPIIHILLHFLRLFSCFYEDLTVFWPPSWWLRWTRPLFWLVLVSSKFWTLWQILVSLLFLAMCFKSLFEPISSVAFESVTQSIIFHGIFINYTNTIRQRSKLSFFLLIALKVS